MAPIGDDTVQSLQELVNKLETRVKQLEDKLQHASSGTTQSATEGVRMILMGPPGAGAWSLDLEAILVGVNGPVRIYWDKSTVEQLKLPQG
jgi:adenylate kinase